MTQETDGNTVKVVHLRESLYFRVVDLIRAKNGLTVADRWGEVRQITTKGNCIGLLRNIEMIQQSRFRQVVDRILMITGSYRRDFIGCIELDHFNCKNEARFEVYGESNLALAKQLAEEIAEKTGLRLTVEIIDLMSKRERFTSEGGDGAG